MINCFSTLPLWKWNRKTVSVALSNSYEGRGISSSWDLDHETVEKYYNDREKLLDEIESLQQELGEVAKRPDRKETPRPIEFDYEKDDPVNIEGNALQQFEKPNQSNTIGFSAFGSYVYFKYVTRDGSG